MPRKKNKTELMIEYLLPRLEAGGKKFEPGENKLDGIGKINFLKFENKRIFLIDRVLSDSKYQQLLNIASGKVPYRGNTVNYEHVSIFYKDGIIGFRSAAFGEKAGIKGIKYKQLKDLSLKDYTNDEVSRMMLLFPMELIALKKDNNIWYFQPKSENHGRLEEAVVKYRFTPVRFNYSYMDQESKFIPANKESKRIYINKLVNQLSDSIKLENSQLMNSYQPPEIIQGRLF